MNERLRVVIGLLGTLLAVELAVRFTPADQIAVPSIQNITMRKVEWLAKQPPAEVLIVGDSTGHRGISVEAFSEGAGGARALNASITSGSPIIVRAMTEHLPWTPKKVVFTLSPFLLSDGWTSEPHEIEMASFAERWELAGGGPAVLSTAWVTYRRRYLIKPTAKAIALGTAGAAEVRDFGPRVGIEDAYGSIGVRVVKADFDDAAAKWAAWTSEAPRLGVRYAALERLAARWKEQGVEVTYVLMPVHSSLRAIGSSHDEAWSFTTRALRPLGGRILDCRAAAPDVAFYDSDHIREGAERDAFSKALAASIFGLETRGCVEAK